MLKSIQLLSENIGRLMRDRGLSQTEFARKVGVSPTYLNQVLSGKNASPKLAHLEKMAAELGVTVAYLFADQDDQPSITNSVRVVREFLQQLEIADDETVRKFLEILKKG